MILRARTTARGRVGLLKTDKGSGRSDRDDKDEACSQTRESPGSIVVGCPCVLAKAHLGLSTPRNPSDLKSTIDGALGGSGRGT
jgi:hypothetical protein